MRIVTSYAYTLDVESADEAELRFKIYRGVMDDWLLEQGVSDPRTDSPSDTFIQLERRDVSHKSSKIDGFVLNQPILESSYMLYTRIELACKESALALFAQLSVERKTDRIAPTNVPVACPRPLATILGTGHWLCGQDRLLPHLRRAFGPDEGRRLAEHIASPGRTTPIVLLANLGKPIWTSVPQQGPYSEDVWQSFIAGLENEVGGLSQIVEVDAAASDELDSDMEGILVRLFWPLGDGELLDDQHPAWAPFDYYFELDERDDPLEYDIHYGGTGNPNPSWVTVFRRHELMALLPAIRDAVFQQAAWQPIPSLIDEVRRSYEIEQREKFSEQGDWEQIADSYQRDAKREHDRADREESRANALERENVGLKRSLKELQVASDREKSRSKAIESVLPTTESESPDDIVHALRIASE
ncbi:MAG: hypothetical protein F4102_03740, partial [Chloroflexi bacterium]|nr:hypothetical protein [Chloroflexota bacterium]